MCTHSKRRRSISRPCPPGHLQRRLVNCSDLDLAQMFLGFSNFFFSSRRRHTRLVSDWSSDVCSSDLFSRLRCGSRPCSTITVPCFTSSGRKFASGQGVPSITSQRVPPPSTLTKRDFNPSLCPPVIAQRHPFSIVASSSANHSPTRRKGSV